MVKLLARFVLFTAVLLSFAGSAKSRVVINEVLANPPQGENSLQWIEIFNDSAYGKELIGYRIETSSHVYPLPDSLVLQAFDYYIVCRQLITTMTNPGFESVWGDTSGIWGDTDYEFLLQKPLVISLSLDKSADYVRLYKGSELISEIVWNSISNEGVSLERTASDSPTILPCDDITGATPFDINSVTPIGHDLALRRPHVSSSDGTTAITFTIKNSGYDTVQSATLTLLQSVDTITTFLISELPPGDSAAFEWSGQFSGLYAGLQAKLSDDDRSRNNSINFEAAGDLFPSFTLSEIAPSERDGIQAEWIELHKRVNGPVDLAKWKLRTEHGEAVILPFTQFINDEYVILTENAVNFMASYPNVTTTVIEVADWVTLINDAGTVSVYDSNRILADSFNYSNGNDILVWSRETPDLHSGWGASAVQLGTPGEPNQTTSITDSSVSLSVSPQILGTDASGNNLMHISFTAPQETAITIKIFDRAGGVVQNLLENSKISNREIVWNGLDDKNRQLPVGMYILYFQAGTGKGIKQPIVIAR